MTYRALLKDGHNRVTLGRNPTRIGKEGPACLNSDLTEGDLVTLDDLVPSVKIPLREALQVMVDRGVCKVLTTKAMAIAFCCPVSLIKEFEKEAGVVFVGAKHPKRAPMRL